jgi:hypothetical protein
MSSVLASGLYFFPAVILEPTFSLCVLEVVNLKELSRHKPPFISLGNLNNDSWSLQLYHFCTPGRGLAHYGHCPVTAFFLSPVQSSSQAPKKQTTSVLSLVCPQDTWVPNPFLFVMCSESQISQKMADSTFTDMYVWCERPTPLCSNPSSHPPETRNNTEDAEWRLLIEHGRSLHVGCAQGEERNKGEACRWLLE